MILHLNQPWPKACNKWQLFPGNHAQHSSHLSGRANSPNPGDCECLFCLLLTMTSYKTQLLRSSWSRRVHRDPRNCYHASGVHSPSRNKVVLINSQCDKKNWSRVVDPINLVPFKTNAIWQLFEATKLYTSNDMPNVSNSFWSSNI